jgi:hypothetical protein
MFAKIYKWAEGKSENALPPNSTPFTVKQLQEIVGGYFDIVELSPKICKRLGAPAGSIAVVNENGRYCAPENAAVSLAIRTTMYGDILVCSNELVDPDDSPEEESGGRKRVTYREMERQRKQQRKEGEKRLRRREEVEKALSAVDGDEDPQEAIDEEALRRGARMIAESLGLCKLDKK